ncbi:MAG: hypothetical protein ACR2IF_14325 [Terriglobales bacterium]
MRHLGQYLTVAIAAAAFAAAQTAYTPQFKGDPAHSTAEAVALGYMRTVGNAEKLYNRKHGAYATTLHDLVGTGSFTRRMISPQRGDYAVKFHSTGKEFTLAMTPNQFDAAHRAFFMDETGVIRAEDDKPATASSPPVTANR